MFKIHSEWSDGVNVTARIEPSGRARFGTNVESPANTFLDIDPALGLATFRGAIEVVGTIPYGSVSGTPTLGALAAKNSVAYGTGDVSGFGALAAKSALAYGDAELTGLGSFAALNGIALSDARITAKTLDNIVDTVTRSALNTTLVYGGNIRVGTGVKDSTLNGFHIDAGEIVGQLAGVDQVVMDAAGRIKAGAGAVTLDANGIDIAVATFYSGLRGYTFDASGIEVGGLYGYQYNKNAISLRALETGVNGPVVEITAEGSAGYPGRVFIGARGAGGYYVAAIYVEANTAQVSVTGNFVTAGTVTASNLPSVRTTSAAW